MTRKSKKHARRRARENALALLYSGDIMEADATSIVEDGGYPANDVHLSEYAESLISGVTQHLEEIDAHLVASSENWTLERMPVVDRAILRLAVYEMLYVDDVPVSVAINEAVELAKAYGGEDESSRFVNGVLGRIARAEEGKANNEESESGAEAKPVEEAETAESAGSADDSIAEPDGMLEPAAEKAAEASAELVQEPTTEVDGAAEVASEAVEAEEAAQKSISETEAERNSHEQREQDV